MNQKTLKTLEFHKILSQLETFASSELGVERVRQLQPSRNFQEVVALQDETDEAAHVLRLRGHAPLDGIFQIKSQVKHATIGGVLSPEELNQVASTIDASRAMRQFMEELLENEVDLSTLEHKVNELPILTSLEQQIKRAIDENGDVLDLASSTLRNIRQQLRRVESRIRQQLETLIRNRNAQKMLSDAIVTIRNDRYVIPVKQEYRSYYRGIVHDQSASGQTLFIEPQAVVDLNNELRELQLKERQEIERILIELTLEVSKEADALMQLEDIMASLDFIFAKARFAKEINATRPKVNEDGIIKLYKARHPLLPIEEVVENDIFLGEKYTTIVITGPNTGGKTITLKTVGLLTLMGQAGLQIPSGEGSEIGVFKDVFADIGDEQSIEQSLSTFSSHMVNIVDILSQVDEHSLVLFDELGAGTDPQEGSALAISILDDVYLRGARVIATTHYPELKAYGYNREGVINASVEFDVETLRPTYRLLIGVPGRSNAFEISSRIGLSEKIIQNAKSMLTHENDQVENMIASLEKNRREAEKNYEDARYYLKNAEQLHRDLQQQMMKFYEHEEKLYKRAEEKAQEVIEKAKTEAEQVMKELRQMRQQSVKEHELIEVRRKLDEATPQGRQKHLSATYKPVKQQRLFRPGDEVKVLTLGQKGTLIEKVSSDEWEVQMGILKMKVPEKEMEFIQSEQKKQQAPITTVRGKNYHVGLELDIRGERLDDALLKVEKYIDDALLANHPRVQIIHGKGTGALRAGVTEYLKQHRSVKRMRLGGEGEGGSGVTVVDLK